PTIAVSRTGWRLRNRAGHGFVPLARLRQFLPGDSMRSRIDPLLGMSVAGVLGLTIVQLLAQTATGVFEGRAAFADCRADRPGVRRLIKPRDLPPPQPKDSVANRARIAQRTDEQPVVPSGFAVNLFASGLTTPRLIRAAPNGDIFVAESRAGRVSVLRPDGGVAAKKSVFASRAELSIRRRLLSARRRATMVLCP